MQDAHDTGPVKAKAALVDSRTMTVLWLNESAAQALQEPVDLAKQTVTIEQIVPMASQLGMGQALCEVADTGEPRHLHTRLVSTAKGGIEIVISIYRVPDGALLVLMENAWQPKAARSGTHSLNRRKGSG